ncbi:MAG: isochorismatase family protein [Chloroflexi bacterium]|nr:isochorismatase family protein [Chloroflexota bacterium]
MGPTSAMKSSAPQCFDGLTAEKVVLIVVDVQDRLMPVIHAASEVIAGCRRAIRGCGVLQIPIVLTEQYPVGLGHTVEPVREVLGDISPIEKLDFGCFTCDDFRDQLEELNRPVVAICGVEAHICVYQTALQAQLLGYQVLLLEDAIGARTRSAREVGLRAAYVDGARPSHSEMLLYQLQARAGTREFRDLLKIVKEEQ